MKGVKIYDNGGRSFDQFTVAVDNAVYSMSANPLSPQGFCQYVGEVKNLPGWRQGLARSFAGLPQEVQRAITRILAEHYESTQKKAV